MDWEFPKGMGDQVEKIMEIPGGRGSNAKLSGTENPVGWGVKLEKTLRGGVWIFSGTTQCELTLLHCRYSLNYRETLQQD